MKEGYFFVTSILGVAGVVLALMAWPCAWSHAINPQDTLMPSTRMPMALIGVVGYATIALTAFWAMGSGNNQFIAAVINDGLVIFTWLFTIFLVIRSFQVHLLCPGCWCCWALNCALLYRFVQRLCCG